MGLESVFLVALPLFHLFPSFGAVKLLLAVNTTLFDGLGIVFIDPLQFPGEHGSSPCMQKRMLKRACGVWNSNNDGDSKNTLGGSSRAGELTSTPAIRIWYGEGVFGWMVAESQDSRVN